jgi:hypothetical protein
VKKYAKKKATKRKGSSKDAFDTGTHAALIAANAVALDSSDCSGFDGGGDCGGF